MGRATWSTCYACCGATCGGWTYPGWPYDRSICRGVDMQDASLARAALAGAVLDEAFAYPTAVALSADGAFLVGGTPTGELRLWRTADRTLMLAAQAHIGVGWGVRLTEDGKLLASSGADGMVRLWSLTGVAQREGMRGIQEEAASGQLLATLR